MQIKYKDAVGFLDKDNISAKHFLSTFLLIYLFYYYLLAVLHNAELSSKKSWYMIKFLSPLIEKTIKINKEKGDKDILKFSLKNLVMYDK